MIAERVNIACYKTEHSFKSKKTGPPLVDSPKERDLMRRAVGRSRNRGCELACVVIPAENQVAAGPSVCRSLTLKVRYASWYAQADARTVRNEIQPCFADVD